MRILYFRKKPVAVNIVSCLLKCRNSVSMSSTDLSLAAALICIILLNKRRIRQSRFERCLKCNPNAVLERSKSDSDSSYTTRSSTLGECSCTSSSSSLVTTEHTGTVDKSNKKSRVYIDEPKSKPVEVTSQNCIQPGDNVDCVNSAIENTGPKMRRYPIGAEDISYKYLIGRNREVTTGLSQNACPSSGTGESFTRHMAEIEYWVKTHRPPCTYGMPLSVANIDGGTTNLHNSSGSTTAAKTTDTKQNNMAMKRPHDPDSSPETLATKKLSTHETEESSKPIKHSYFASAMKTSHRKSELNGKTSEPAEVKPVCKTNGKLSTELLIKSRIRKTSTPSKSRVVNVENGTKNNNSGDVTKKIVLKVAKMKTEVVEVVKSQTKASAGPSCIARESRDPKPMVMNDSDTSVLTAPYIRSTRNGASKTKCQSLARQRASGTQNEYFPTRSFTKRHKRKDLMDTSFETKESSGANNSKLSDSSLDIFGGDVTKDSTNSRKSTLRSWSGKLATLHFSGCKGSEVLKRRSEPVVTRQSSSRSTHADVPAPAKRLNATVNGAPGASKMDNDKIMLPDFCESDKGSFSKKKFFV